MCVSGGGSEKGGSQFLKNTSRVVDDVYSCCKCLVCAFYVDYAAPTARPARTQAFRVLSIGPCRRWTKKSITPFPVPTTGGYAIECQRKDNRTSPKDETKKNETVRGRARVFTTAPLGRRIHRLDACREPKSRRKFLEVAATWKPQGWANHKQHIQRALRGAEADKPPFAKGANV